MPVTSADSLSGAPGTAQLEARSRVVDLAGLVAAVRPHVHVQGPRGLLLREPELDARLQEHLMAERQRQLGDIKIKV